MNSHCTVALPMLSAPAQAQCGPIPCAAFPYIAQYGPAVVGMAQRGTFNRAYDGYNQYVAPSVRQGANWSMGNFGYVTTPQTMPRAPMIMPRGPMLVMPRRR